MQNNLPQDQVGSLSTSNKTDIFSTNDPNQSIKIAGLEKKISDYEKKLDKDFEEYKEKQSIRMVEFLGIFAAIISFISISGNIMIQVKSTIEILILLPAFALALMIFVLGIRTLIVKKSELTFWVIAVILLVLVGVGVWYSGNLLNKKAPEIHKQIKGVNK